MKIKERYKIKVYYGITDKDFNLIKEGDKIKLYRHYDNGCKQSMYIVVDKRKKDGALLLSEIGGTLQWFYLYDLCHSGYIELYKRKNSILNKYYERFIENFHMRAYMD